MMMHLITEFEISIVREKFNAVESRNYRSIKYMDKDTSSPVSISVLPSDMTIQSVSPNSSTNVLRFSDTKTEFQYYLIGIYSFLGVLFVIGFIIILARKFKKSCSSSKSSCRDEYEAVVGRQNCNPQDNPGFEHPPDSLGIERTQGHDSDYDYYSDEESDSEISKDIPPAYEHPPPYYNASPH